jgi:hypothetical protein
MAVDKLVKVWLKSGVGLVDSTSVYRRWRIGECAGNLVHRP